VKKPQQRRVSAVQPPCRLRPADPPCL